MCVYGEINIKITGEKACDCVKLTFAALDYDYQYAPVMSRFPRNQNIFHGREKVRKFAGHIWYLIIMKTGNTEVPPQTNAEENTKPKKAVRFFFSLFFTDRAMTVNVGKEKQKWPYQEDRW